MEHRGIEERRERILSDEDVAAIVRAMSETTTKIHPSHCVFDEDTRSLLRMLSKVYGDARSASVKGVVALLIIGGLLVAAFGAGVIKPE